MRVWPRYLSGREIDAPWRAISHQSRSGGGWKRTAEAMMNCTPKWIQSLCKRLATLHIFFLISFLSRAAATTLIGKKKTKKSCAGAAGEKYSAAADQSMQRRSSVLWFLLIIDIGGRGNWPEQLFVFITYSTWRWLMTGLSIPARHRPKNWERPERNHSAPHFALTGCGWRSESLNRASPSHWIHRFRRLFHLLFSLKWIWIVQSSSKWFDGKRNTYFFPSSLRGVKGAGAVARRRRLLPPSVGPSARQLSTGASTHRTTSSQPSVVLRFDMVLIQILWERLTFLICKNKNKKFICNEDFYASAPRRFNPLRLLPGRAQTSDSYHRTAL